MSDFEQWALQNGYCHRDLVKNANGDYCTPMAVHGFKAFNGAIASKQGEAVEYQIKILGERWTHCAKHIYDPSNPNTRALFTYPPDAAAEIARLTKELEEARKVPDGYALVTIDPTDEMLEYTLAGTVHKDDNKELMRTAYQMMLSAAPDAAISKIGGGECEYAKSVGAPEYRCAVKCMHKEYLPKRLMYEEIVQIMEGLKLDSRKALLHDFAHAIMDKMEAEKPATTLEKGIV